MITKARLLFKDQYGDIVSKEVTLKERSMFFCCRRLVDVVWLAGDKIRLMFDAPFPGLPVTAIEADFSATMSGTEGLHSHIILNLKQTQCIGIQLLSEEDNRIGSSKENPPA